MVTLFEPTDADVRNFLARQGKYGFSYQETGVSRTGFPRDYTVDRRQVRLGAGQQTWNRAKKAVQDWRMFQMDWIKLCWAYKRIATTSTVAVLAFRYGLWWVNACRIVYVIDEEQPHPRFGFAYGTLLDHVAQGEERFSVEWRPDDTVWFDVYAFSRIKHWGAKLFYPLARRTQKKFHREALAAMVRAVQAEPQRQAVYTPFGDGG